MTNYVVLYNLGLREVLIVDLNNLMEESALLSMDYYNMYHIKTPPLEVDRSDAWYTIICSAFNCLDKFSVISKNVSKLNKYFWSNRRFIKSIGYSSGHIYPSHRMYRRIANENTLNGFIEFLILQDVLIPKSASLTPLHLIPSIRHLGQRIHQNRMFSFIPYGFKPTAL